MGNAANRRRFRRVPFAFDVEIEELRGGNAACQRIAAAGLYLYAPNVLPVGQTVHMSFCLPDRSHTRVVTQGRILHSQREDSAAGTLGGMRILFVGLDEHDEAAIRSFVLNCIRREEEYSSAGASIISDERRVYQARFFGTESDTDSYVVDISEGGLYVRTLELPTEQEDVHIDLYLPGAGAVHRVEGRVVWRRPNDPNDPNDPGQGGVGVEFRSLPAEDARLIRSFVDIFGSDAEDGASAAT